MKILPLKFFTGNTLETAPKLLGKVLVRKIRNKEIRILITEVEAYDGPKDKASHAFRGKTERNSIMFKKGGRFYVYFTYGMHWLLNIVTGPKNYPAAILIRSGLTAEQRGTNADLCRNKTKNNLTIEQFNNVISGPARLTKFLKIDGKFNKLSADQKNGLWLEDGIQINPKKITAKKRIGVDYAGPVWAKKKWNFSINIE